MTFQDIQNEVMDRLGKSSGVARSRVGRSINERYRWLASSIGLQTSARGVVTADTVIGNRVLTFGPTPTQVEKLYTVFDAATTPITVLGEVSFGELRDRRVSTGKARFYAVQTMGATSVTIMLNATPTAIYTLSADAQVNLSILSGAQVPVFAESYHDLLLYGAMATELELDGKYDEAKVQEMRCKERTADLRLFIAKSAYQEIYQGKNAPWWPTRF